MANDLDNGTVPAAPFKRKIKKADSGGGSPTEAKKAKLDPLLVNNNRNPVSILNELRVGLKYNCVGQSGPSHAPVFKVAVEVDGQTYHGVGRSKKIAKCKAAEEALKSFIQLPDNTNMAYTTTTDTTSMDFTSDDAFEAAQNKKAAAAAKKITTKGPVMLINELYPNINYECSENGTCAYSRFKVTITLGGEKFFGTGSSKKLAKNAAATSALAKLNFDLKDVFLKDSCKRLSAQPLDQEKADYIGRIIQEKFASLMDQDPVHAKRKVLSGIVMTSGGDLTDSQIISITTGTKCVSGEHISMNGCSLNDMHAEIVARRCLMSYLYDQLELIANSREDESIFVAREDKRGYRLRDGLEFHLYINTAPCGDARIFSPHEEGDAVDKHPNRSSRGQLRNKIESGEGTIPVKVNTSLIQTWDGILQGERLLTMSCSDKICRWNVIGMQGALLSHYVEPIYLKSIVLGSLMRESHLYRALFGRIENTIQGLPPPYRLNRPSTYLMTSSETRQPCKTPHFSVVWATGDPKPEIINTTIGKPETGVSKFCKQNLMKKFANLIGRISSITEVEKNVPCVYAEAKEAVTSYKVAKESLYQAFIKAGLGHWVSKPIEQDTFELEHVNQTLG